MGWGGGGGWYKFELCSLLIPKFHAGSVLSCHQRQSQISLTQSGKLFSCARHIKHIAHPYVTLRHQQCIRGLHWLLDPDAVLMPEVQTLDPAGATRPIQQDGQEIPHPLPPRTCSWPDGDLTLDLIRTWSQVWIRSKSDRIRVKVRSGEWGSEGVVGAGGAGPSVVAI